MRDSRQFCVSILKRGRKTFRSEHGRGGRTNVMFTQTRIRGDQAERKSTPGINSSQGDPVPRKHGQFYRHTECYSFHCYGHSSNQCPYRKSKAINISMIRVMLMQHGDMIKKRGYFWILVLHTA